MQKVNHLLPKLLITAMGWMPLGIGAALTVSAIKEPDTDYKKVIFSSIFTAVWGLVVSFSQKIYGKIDARLDTAADSLVDFILERINEFAGSMWVNLPLRFKGRYYQALVYLCRDFKPPRQAIKYRFIPRFERMHVPVSLSRYQKNRLPQEIIESADERESSVQIWQFLSKNANESGPHIVILAEAGSGKTTLLKHLAITYAQNRQNRHQRRARKLIPVLIYLRDFSDSIKHPDWLKSDLPNMVESYDFIKDCKPQRGWFKTRLLRGECLVMLDGLDEIAENDSLQKVSNWLNKQISRYHKNVFIVTSRPHAYEASNLKNVTEIQEVCPFGLSQIDTFIRNWYLEDETRARGLSKADLGVIKEAKKRAGELTARIRHAPFLFKMASNPLLLTMISTIHSNERPLPKSRAALYEAICDVLLSRQKEKNIKDPLGLNIVQKKRPLQSLALRLMTDNVSSFSVEYADSIIQKSLEEVTHDRQISTYSFLENVRKTSGLVIDREDGSYEFYHRSFKEYLTSLEIDRIKQESILLNNIDALGWRETIRLYSANYTATSIVETAIGKATPSSVKLAYECLLEAPQHLVAPHLKEKIDQWLDDHKGSKDTESYAAEIKILQRIDEDNLVQISSSSAISPDFVSCREYQIFVNEKLAVGEYRQPDCWKSYDYVNIASPNSSILGVRADDAQLYCDWLTERLVREETVYRLPTSDEEKYIRTLENVQKTEHGCWCNDAKGQRLEGFGDYYVDELRRYLTTASGEIMQKISRTRDKHSRLKKNLVNYSESISKTRKIEDLLIKVVHVNFNLPNSQFLGLDLSLCQAIVKDIEKLNEIFDLFRAGLRDSNHRTIGKARAKVQSLRSSSVVLQKKSTGRFSKLVSLVSSLSNSSGTDLSDSSGTTRDFHRKRIQQIIEAYLELLTHEVNSSICLANSFERELNYMKEKLVHKIGVPGNIRKGANPFSEFFNYIDTSLPEMRDTFQRYGSEMINSTDYACYTYILNEKNTKQSRKIVEHQLDLLLSRAIPSSRQLYEIRRYTLIVSSFWFSMRCIYGKLYEKDRIARGQKSLSIQDCKRISGNFARKRYEALRFYIWVLVLEGQIARKIPAGGGIRIVREMLTPDAAI